MISSIGLKASSNNGTTAVSKTRERAGSGSYKGHAEKKQQV
jgi:hypothetical protein